MAHHKEFNNSGYQGGWPHTNGLAYTGDGRPGSSSQQPVAQDQSQVRYQQSMQYQGQPGINQQPNLQQSYSAYRHTPSPRQFQSQQQFQNHSVPSSVMQSSPHMPQYDRIGGSGSYGQPVQAYSPHPRHSPQTYSPLGQSHGLTSQQNQYFSTQPQHSPMMPQRQLSYSQPQQYQRSSPQPPHNSTMSYPVPGSAQYQRPSQSPVERPNGISLRPDQMAALQLQSRSPSVQTSRESPDMAISPQQSSVGHIQSPRMVAQPQNSSFIPSSSLRSEYPQFSSSTPMNDQQYPGRPALHNASSGELNNTRQLSQSSQRANSLQSSIPASHLPRAPPDSNFPVRRPKDQNQTTQQSASNGQVTLEAKATAAKVATKMPDLQQAIVQGPRPHIAQESRSVIREESVPVHIPAKAPTKPKETTHSQVKAEVSKTSAHKVKPEPISDPITEVDYALLLIDLAEEYFDAAYGASNDEGFSKREPNLAVFYKLVSTGLGCLEIVLKQWKTTLKPAVEAGVRLRYAAILYEETKNTSEAEEVLSKGIAQCDRFRLLDFKYNMHHLLARVTSTTNPKAAIKYVDSVIKDAEAENHIPWIYAFRFLRASLSLEMNQSQETLQALNQLKSILNQAKSRGDIAIAAAASALEAMTYINRANTPEAIEQAQQALATVRSAENNPNVPRIPQLVIMAHFVDLMCSLFKADSDTAVNKKTNMYDSMDTLAQHNTWTRDGTFLIPIGQQSAKSTPGVGSSHGVIVSQKSERTCLKMAWLPKNELYAMGNMLAASTVMHKAASDKKCEELLDNADAFLKFSQPSNPRGLNVVRDLSCHLQVLKVFASCSKNAWSEAKKELNSLKVTMANMPDATKSSLPASIIYLEGMIAQGTGDTRTALALYSNPMLALPDSLSVSTKPPILVDLATLAALNTILIVHSPSHPQHSKMAILLSALEDLDKTTASGNLRGAYFLIKALHSDAYDPSDNPILNTKNNLREVLQIARKTANSQFSCISLTFMTDRFFKGQIGDQAYKSASVALNLARKGKNDLWTSVAENLLAGVLETRGNSEEAKATMRESVQLASRLPSSMQAFEQGQAAGQ